MEKSLQSFCVEHGMEYLLDQWDTEKNADLTPALIMPGSNKKICWRCKEDHEWQATVKSRTQGAGCPICTNRLLKVGENDFSTMYPDEAKQWHPTLNGELMPDQVFAGSKKKVWWLCEKGHEYLATIASRTTMRTGCPVCSGRVVLPGVNDLASAFPAIAEQWHPSKNEKWKPSRISPFSNRRVWWQCEKGHEWPATVAHRTASGSGCPYCAGRKVLAGFNDLETKFPNVAEQWHPTLNEGLTAQMVTPGSHKRVWWQCPVGHIWKAVVYSRVTKRGHGCPVCAGKVNKDWELRYSEALKETP